MPRVMHRDDPAPAPETFFTVADRIGAVMRHGVGMRRRISVLGHGLSYLIAIGLGLSP